MKFSRIFFSVVLALVWWTATASLEAHARDVDQELAAQGGDLASKLCSRCHAVGAEGESPFETAPEFRNMVKYLEPEDLAEAFAEGIVVAHEAMPEFRFEPEEIGMLIEYLKSLQDL